MQVEEVIFILRRGAEPVLRLKKEISFPKASSQGREWGRNSTHCTNVASAKMDAFFMSTPGGSLSDRFMKMPPVGFCLLEVAWTMAGQNKYFQKGA